jgi:hypothetical protein
MIFEDMVKSGYGDMCKEYDSYIDYTYGSLRYRDEQVERIGKKYQKIYLYREMGNIFDNYKYAPKYRYSDVVELVYPEQGNSFRNIDLTIIPRINRFDGVKFIYPFYRYSKWSDKVWFKNNDVERYFPRLIECVYNGEEYYLLQGYLSSEEKKDEFREVWVQVRTYLYQKDKKSDLLRWFDGKDFEGRWMPEGFGQLYECCIGEYPWSPTMVNYLGLEEEQDFRQESPAPCYLITTVNDYTAEKDSPFCTIENSSYMLPSKYLMEKMNLSWDGAWGYDSIGRKAIIVGRNNTIYIKKSFLLDFMEQNELDIVWTVLGEKEKIITDYGTDFPGRREFSYTYYLGCKNELIRNHEKYNVVKSQKY